MNTIGVVMIPRRRTTAPSTETNGHMLGDGATNDACDATGVSVSPSRVYSASPANKLVAATMPKSAVPPIDDGPTKMR